MTPATAHEPSPFTRILCPVDFSRHSRAALQQAAAIARQAKGRLTVLFVADPLLSAAAAAAELDTARLAAKTRRELRDFAARATARSGLKRSQIELEISEGATAGEILRIARQRPVDLVAMGTQGLSGGRRIVFGSTTQRVLRSAEVPVLAVPAGSRVRPGRSWPGGEILAAVELGASLPGDAASAALVAEWTKASLTLLHVVPPMQLPGWVGSGLRRHDRTRANEARKALEEAAARLNVRTVTTCEVVIGQPAEQIAVRSGDRRIALVVLTLRTIQGLIVGVPQGTTTYRVLSSASVPVLALPAAWRGQAGESART
ncbi:MAG: universal stress protein [Vicinamibacterales bacterium]